MARRVRVDAELVRRGLARSREHAVELIAARRVQSAGAVIAKPATAIEVHAPLHIVAGESDDNWASRGAHKLVGALERFESGGLQLKGRRCLDAGASTGGFTDVLLRRGVSEVAAVDVGYGQLVWRLQNDPRVNVFDRTNVRNLEPLQIGGDVDVIVADLSFISLELVLPAFARCAKLGADVLPMVKPQFEVGKERLGSGGVVRDSAMRREVVVKVACAAVAHGFDVRDVVASPLPGPSGNVEYFLWLTKAAVVDKPSDQKVASEVVEMVEHMVRRAVDEGPQ
ncbi:TlyA family RNA methyltransferase [Hoyosella rhizosphaerae]|uniref:TlyA family rRNA (Cytidine-2'-O)-methyltransferase n=1 Tax=Hoyosella rhizosphaerae TaxID=1755582 RepID=A0A916XCD9_9ACTN|nr:TlyA family RNA methyltransferase [Hoyosella rhizosphaerae]MBN4926183.1 TlyA family RNA methyltransferase [Hoyosella rhizosphaerae]GGC61450.1 TlyA family rRNA (cytidine-2'-O)-methyltransferase [Hoyosella rhizosphaerae]